MKDEIYSFTYLLNYFFITSLQNLLSYFFPQKKTFLPGWQEGFAYEDDGRASALHQLNSLPTSLDER
jgi:hypothetical protein